MQLKPLWTATIVWLTALSLSAQENWSLIKEEEGIKVFTRTEPRSDYKAFKAEMRLNCGTDDIVKVFKNTNNVNDWVVNCNEVKLLKEENNYQYYYIETSLPWPFENRDMIYRFQYLENDSHQVKIVVTGIPQFVQPKEGIVRMAKANGYWLLTPVGAYETAVSYQMHVEPGGFIPAWLANLFIVDVPLSTFKELRKLVK